MKNVTDLAIRVCRIAVFAITVFAVTAPTVFGQGKSPYPCSRTVNIISEPDFYEYEDNASPCKPAKEALDAAAIIVTGRTARSLDGKEISDTELVVWIDALSKDPEYAAKFNEGLGFVDAVKWLKARIGSNLKDRRFAIGNAIEEVHGRKPTSDEEYLYDNQVKAQKAWYATIVLAEITNLNKDKSLRVSMLNNVYKRTMGRNATPTDLQYWQSRTEHARIIVQAARAFLYSPDGAKDLFETVKRALDYIKPGKPPTDQQVQKALSNLKNTNFIFDQMISPKIKQALIN
jgi:hypothetical protein